ncbi:MAG: peptide chain release factor 3 [Candidatus Sumerlaeaceae bacterium]
MIPLEEILRRRTFAIISHPDAGKTTLTEKLLLYGGALQLAGSVTERKNQRAATSDWMELERKRGISISSTVLQFDYDGYRINLLDTPGHKDFSEDTYRVLTAVDAVVMVIDAAKGIEAQTRKLFEICRRRGVPIFTFMNKLDRPGKEPMELLDELESVLGIHAYAMNWPLGMGPDFKGVFDRMNGQVHFFERTSGGAYRAPVKIVDLHDATVREQMGETAAKLVIDELEMLEGAGASFCPDEVLAGRVTPVFFGSASNNFGVQMLLDSFLQYSTPPRARMSTSGEVIDPRDPAFSGFVFKIQANMDPNHRDRIAFIRICSGKFERDMVVVNPRTGARVRLSSSHKLFGQKRETVDEGYAGDVIGVVGHSNLHIGDTLTDNSAVVYDEIPRFAPECFAMLVSSTTAQFKRFREGLDQLLQEGVVQGLYMRNTTQRVPLLAAVGPLQFEVVQYRLQSEYGADTRLDTAPYQLMRWISPDVAPEVLADVVVPSGAALADDSAGQPVILFSGEWAVPYFTQRNPDIRLSELPFRETASAK